MIINISEIQHFCVGDGEGIRTTVFFKGCNLCCPWCHNPENIPKEPSVMNYESICKKQIIGRKVSVKDILPELLEDEDFYIQSGGGVTLSGGEVMLQPEGAAFLAAVLKEKGISVLIDTAGCVSYKAFELLNPLVKGYLFDFKTADKDNYQKIGGNLDIISQNLEGLIHDGIKLQVRIPLIPDFNTDKEDILQICNHLTNLGVKEVELLPFHRLGSAKYQALGIDYLYKDYHPFTKEKLNEINKIYSKYFKTTIER